MQDHRRWSPGRKEGGEGVIKVLASLLILATVLPAAAAAGAALI